MNNHTTNPSRQHTIQPTRSDSPPLPPLRLRSEFSRKAKGRLRSISYLRGRNRTKREEVREWLED